MKRALLTIITVFSCVMMMAQGEKINPEDRKVDMDSPTFVPMVRVGKVLDGKDSIKYVEMNNVYVFGPLVFKNERQRKAYNKLVWNVKKVLPIAKEINHMIVETYEYMETLPNDKARKAHMKVVERELKQDYTPRMKKLTLTQGKLLIKLVYRETNSSTYDLVKAFLGTTKAVFYQTFAWMFGASLKKVYDPEGEDKLTERVVRQVESGQL